MNGRTPQSDYRAGAGPRPAPQSEAPGTGNLLAEMRSGEAGADVPPPVVLKPRRKLKVQNVIVAVVIVVSIVALYAMRRYGMGAGFTFSVTPIDYQIDGQSGRLTPEQRRILRDLQLGNEPIRLAMAQLRKNPFRLTTEEVEVFTPGPVTPGNDAEAERAQQIASVLSRLELNSVMLGRIPLARINARIYKVNDTVEGLFTIKAIHDRTVELEAGGKVFALTIGEPENKNP